MPMFLLRRLVSSSLLAFALLAGLLGNAQGAQAAGSCYCYVFKFPEDAVVQETDVSIFDDANRFDAECFEADATSCAPGNPAINSKYTTCEFQPNAEACSVKVRNFKTATLQDAARLLVSKKNQTNVEAQSNGQTGILQRIMPACVFESTVRGECKDVRIFIKLAIDLANLLLGLVGGIALVAFLIGGFKFILSRGSSDMIESGKNTMVAAVIGLAVVFGAYLLITILADALGLSQQFRLQ